MIQITFLIESSGVAVQGFVRARLLAAFRCRLVSDAWDLACFVMPKKAPGLVKTRGDWPFESARVAYVIRRPASLLANCRSLGLWASETLPSR